jgi:hypothetical protein
MTRAKRRNERGSSFLKIYVDYDAQAGMNGIEKVVLIIHVVDVHVVIVAPVGRPWVGDVEPIATVLEARAALVNLGAMEVEMVLAAETFVEALLGYASVVSGGAPLRLWVVMAVAGLTVAILLGTMLLFGLSFGVLFLGALVLLGLFLLGLAGVLILLSAMLVVFLRAAIVLFSALLVLFLRPMLVVLDLTRILFGALLFFLRVLLWPRFFARLRMFGRAGVFRVLSRMFGFGFFLAGMVFSLESKAAYGAEG